MISPLRLFTISLFLGGMLSQAQVTSVDLKAPDSIVLKGGRTVHGLIIRNTVDSVVLQDKTGEEKTYLKKDIVRIRDEADFNTLYTEIGRKGDLPPWNVIANDLRTHDKIRSLVKIPSTAIDKGEFRNVPYMSFRANQNVEVNIYGNPDDPAGLEFGVYGINANNAKIRHDIRAFLAGFLATRAEIAMLYSLPLKEGIGTVGDLTIEITPQNGLDAYGAWWISIYNKKRLNQARLSEAAYAKVTRPMDEVVDKHGNVLASALPTKEMTLSEHMKDLETSARLLLRGFYRDKDGNFRLIFDMNKPGTTAAQ